MYSKVSEDGKNVVLSNGTNHPIIGFGTYKIGFVPASSNTAGVPGHAPDQDPKEIIKNAVAAGYRYFDCAQFYGNEAMVGAALKDCGVPRAELFLVSKVWGDKMFEGKDAILAQLETTLTDLQTDYLDAYLIHWPIPGKHVEAYKVLEGAYDAKKIRAIGLSNYTVEDYLELEAANIRIPPVVNQIEVNPFLYRPKTLAFFAGKNVAIQSYRALRQGKEMGHEVVQAVASAHGKTPAQVLGRWCVQRGIILVAKTVNEGRMAENMGVLDFSLTPEQLGALDALTTPASLAEFRALYEKCVIRDTPLQGTPEGEKLAKKDITLA